MSKDYEFVKLPKRIAERRDIGSTSKILFSVLLNREGANGRSWPGVRRLSKDCGVSVGAILRSAAEMEALGLLEIIRIGSGRNNQYRIHFGSATEMEALPKWKRSATEMEALSATEMEAQIEQEKRTRKNNPPKPPLAGQGGGPPRRRRMSRLEANLERLRRLGEEEARQMREAEERRRREAEGRDRATATGGGSP